MNRRIETKVSRTATLTCLSRAISYSEKNNYYKSDDYIAAIIIPSFFKIKFIQLFFKRFLVPKGIYEYVISRTKYIDYIFKNLPSNIEQILIFGAGFDSRAIRFKNNLNRIMIFELDSPITQNAKINQFRKMNIELPNNLKFISMDFDKESLKQKLEESGFKKNKTCLFVLEGLTMYLNPESINSTFTVINEFSGKNSMIIFDHIYSSVIKNKNHYYDGKDIVETVSNVGEKWNYGIERGKIDQFLKKYNFELIDESDSNKLEKRFFMDEKGNKIGNVNKTHCLITAII